MLSPETQAEILDFIAFLKVRKLPAEEVKVPRNDSEIETFFRSFKVSVGGYKFDRDEANARYDTRH